MYQHNTCFTEGSSILLTLQKNQLNATTTSRFGSEFGKLLNTLFLDKCCLSVLDAEQ